MNRLTRIFAAALVSMTMLVAAVPAAQARPLGKPQSVQVMDGDWIGAALGWLGQLLGIPRPTPPRHDRQKGDVPTGSGGGGFTGSCIDPNGCITVYRPGQGATNSNTGGK